MTFNNEAGNNIVLYNIRKYEQMLSKNQLGYFDIDEFESIIEYYIENNKLNSALLATDIALKQHPASFEIYLKKAHLYFNKGRIQEALNIINKIQTIEKNNYEIYLLKGYIFNQMNQFKEAIIEFNKAIDLCNEDKDEVLFSIALSIEQSGEYAKAIEYLKKAHRLNPENSEVIYEIAYCYDKINDFTNAHRYYQQYLDINPYSENAWNNLGLAYNALNQDEKAIEAFDFAIALDEKYMPAYMNKAITLINLENYKEAITTLKEYLIHDSSNAQILCLIGECYEKLLDLENARQYYKKTLKANETYAEAWFGLGMIHINTNDLFKALVYIKKAIEFDSKNAEFYYVAGKILNKLNNIAEALKSLKKAVQLEPYNAEILTAYTDLLYFNNQLDKAITSLSEQYANYIDNAIINYRLAVYWNKKNNSMVALNFFKRALKCNFEMHKEIITLFPEITNNHDIVDLINKLKK